MAKITTSLRVVVEDAHGQKTIVERQSNLTTGDNPRFWADRAMREIAELEKLVVSLLEAAHGKLPGRDITT